MTGKDAKEVAGRNLKFSRHPYYPARYAALGENLVRVEIEGGEWGEFDRDARWLDGPVLHADPIYCRWVTGEIIAKNRLRTTKESS